MHGRDEWGVLDYPAHDAEDFGTVEIKTVQTQDALDIIQLKINK